MSAASGFQPGDDVVRLKSGGPKMTEVALTKALD